MRVFDMHICGAIISVWSLLASFKVCYKSAVRVGGRVSAIHISTVTDFIQHATVVTVPF